MSEPEQSVATHTLTLSVPLNLTANPAAEEYDIQEALAQAMNVILPMIRLGTLGLICDQIVATMEPTGGNVVITFTAPSHCFCGREMEQVTSVGVEPQEAHGSPRVLTDEQRFEQLADERYDDDPEGDPC